MASDDKGRSIEMTTDDSNVDEHDLRDLAMREALGLLDEVESATFEAAFARMTPDDQAATLDLQAAVAREVAAAGDEEPDRSLRYRVLARIAEAMDADPAASGPLAVIGSRGASRFGRGSADSASAAGRRELSELQFDRMARSAGVWRVAAFALGSAVLALGMLQYQAQQNIKVVVDRLGDQVITHDLRERVGPEIDLNRYVDQQTAMAIALTGVDDAAGVLLADPPSSTSSKRSGMLLSFKYPQEVQGVHVVAILPEGGERILDFFDISGRSQFAALALDLSDLPETGVTFEVRDAATGVVLLRSA